MRNVQDRYVIITTDTVIKFEEKRSIARFHNPERRQYKRIQVDGCVLTGGIKCDYLLCSMDEREERYVELKGSDIPHAIDQIRETIIRHGEHSDNRHSYIVCTKVLPQISTKIQKAKKEFRDRFHSSLTIKVTPLDERLY